MKKRVLIKKKLLALLTILFTAKGSSIQAKSQIKPTTKELIMRFEQLPVTLAQYDGSKGANSYSASKMKNVYQKMIANIYALLKIKNLPPQMAKHMSLKDFKKMIKKNLNAYKQSLQQLS